MNPTELYARSGPRGCRYCQKEKPARGLEALAIMLCNGSAAGLPSASDSDRDAVGALCNQEVPL